MLRGLLWVMVSLQRGRLCCAVGRAGILSHPNGRSAVWALEPTDPGALPSRGTCCCLPPQILYNPYFPPHVMVESIFLYFP